MDLTIRNTYLHWLLMFTLFISFNHSAFAKPIKIKFSHTAKKDSPKGQMALHFKKLVQERIGDRKVIIEVYSNANLYNDDQSIKALIKGDIQLIAPPTYRLNSYSSRIQVLDLPFLFINNDAAERFLAGEYGQRMLRLFSGKGLTGLGYLHGGMKQLSASSPIKEPNDLKGLRFRIMSSNILEAQFEALNAIPYKIDLKRLHSLLKSKKIDGQENTWSNMYSEKFYQHQSHIIESNHGYVASMVLSNTQFFNSLSDDIKSIVIQSLSDSIKHGNKLAKIDSDIHRKKIIKSRKSKVHKINEEERALWVSAVQPVWNQYKDIIGSELINIAAASR